MINPVNPANPFNPVNPFDPPVEPAYYYYSLAHYVPHARCSVHNGVGL
jgi:hypothetical protein